MSSTTHPRSRHHDGTMAAVSEGLADLKDTVRTGVHDSAESGKKVIQAAGGAALHVASGFGKSARQARDHVGRTISERPFTSVALAAGIGALVFAAMTWRRR